MLSRKTVNAMLVSAVALTVAAGAARAEEAAADKEHCYGVVKAGMNDCANASKTHSCAGHATVDGDTNEWVALPKGLCAKLVNGTTTAPGGETPASEGAAH